MTLKWCSSSGEISEIASPGDSALPVRPIRLENRQYITGCIPRSGFSNSQDVFFLNYGWNGLLLYWIGFGITMIIMGF